VNNFGAVLSLNFYDPFLLEQEETSIICIIFVGQKYPELKYAPKILIIRFFEDFLQNSYF
jgi:hypothetical protein